MVYLLAVIEGITDGFSFLLQLAAIIFPLMLLLSFAEEYEIIVRLSDFFRPLSRPLTISPQATFPLLVGLIFGISYGAGVIIKCAKDGSLSRRDMALVGIFLAVCHAVFEDTLFFVALGADILWVLLFRFFLAALLVSIFGRTVFAPKEKEQRR